MTFQLGPKGLAKESMRVECILGWWVDEYEIPAFEVRKNMLCYKHTPKKTAFGRKEL